MEQPTPSATKSARPMGVTILAVLATIGGVLGLLDSLTFFGLFAAAGAMFLILGLVTLVVSVLYLVFAYGAWTLQFWAWTLGVVLGVVSVVTTLLGLTQGTQEMVGALISLAIAGAILYYLFQADVKAALPQEVRRTRDAAGTHVREAAGQAKRGLVTAIGKIDPRLLADVVIMATALQERANTALKAKGSAYRIGEITITATIPPQVGFAIVRVGDPDVDDTQASGELITEIEAAGEEVESLAGDELAEARDP